MVTTVGLLIGLTLFGRTQRKLLLLAGVWMVLTMLPTLNLAWQNDVLGQMMLPIKLLNVPEGIDNLQQNRHLYLVSVGYITAVAVFLYSAIGAASKLRPIVVGLVASVLVLSVGVCAAQLSPWHTATAQVNDLVAYLLRVVPPQPRASGMTWYSDSLPFKYKGVALLYSGIGISRVLAGGDYPQLQRVPDATQAPLRDDPADAFALRFGYDDTTTRFTLDYVAGITAESELPVAGDGDGSITRVWDFRDCATRATGEWTAVEAASRCEAGKGLVLVGAGADPQLVSGSIDLGAEAGGAGFLRIRVAVKYPPVPDNMKPVHEWFWKLPEAHFSGERLRTLPVKPDGEEHVYWTFVPLREVQGSTVELRLDPINTEAGSEIRWIAVDVAK
jgi:hypothetical protein